MRSLTGRWGRRVRRYAESVRATTRVVLVARWAAWAMALGFELFDILPGDLAAVHWLVLVTFMQNVAATLYLPMGRPVVRRFLNRRGWRQVDDLLVFSLLDMLLALAIVRMTGADESPYYLFALTTLLTPAAVLGPKGTTGIALFFLVGYLLVLSTADGGLDDPRLAQEANRFATFLSLPVAFAVLIQLLASATRRLSAERLRLRSALRKNESMQAEREELAAERERGRIAREIHDGVAQSVYMLSLGLEAATESAGRESSLGRRLDGLVMLAKQTLLEVRQYIFDLKPLLYGEAGVTAALRSQVREFTTVSGLPVAVDVTGDEGSLPVHLDTALYRITQEALANVFRHAEASQVHLYVGFEPESVTLEIRDDGVGIERDRDPGRGITYMRQRVAELHGTLTFKTDSGRGTVLRVVLPKESHG